MMSTVYIQSPSRDRRESGDAVEQSPSRRSGERWRSPADYEAYSQEIQRRNGRILASMHPAPPEVRSIYEVGCGTGILTSELVSRFPSAQIVAVDLSADMLDVATAKSWPDGLTFKHADFLEEDIADRYDAVFSNAALHWMFPHYPEVFARINTVLRDGGVACIATAGRTTAAVEFDSMVAAALRDIAGAGDGEFTSRRLSIVEARNLAGTSGFDVADSFMLERTVQMPPEVYARWLMASGGPWKNAKVPISEAVTLIADRLPGKSLYVIHASAFLLMLKRSEA